WSSAKDTAWHLLGGNTPEYRQVEKDGHNKLHCLTSCLASIWCTAKEDPNAEGGYRKSRVKQGLFAPLNLAGGLLYEVYSCPREIITHGPITWLTDTPGDIASNIIGVGASLGCTTQECCLKACKVSEFIPGPDNGDSRWY